jgi:protein-L-isoaspartate(D-aspartate) O-methyltransferase
VTQILQLRPPSRRQFRSAQLRIALCLAAITAQAAAAAAQTEQQFAAQRTMMVETEVATAGVKNAAVLAAMRTVPRHEFVPADLREYAYFDMALPIGEHQTISPPFIVAWMTQQIDPQPSDRVLEVGTGSGYQAALLSPLVKEVYTIEIVEPLARKAAAVFKKLNYKNVESKIGDGFQGWPEHAPFDKILVTCSPEKIPSPLVEQLREGGRMLIPLGERYQQTLYTLRKVDGKLVTESREPTFFVPMTGKA